MTICRFQGYLIKLCHKFFILSKMKSVEPTIYLDHAATTPIDPRVLKVMMPYQKEVYGNPSSLYRSGRTASRVVQEARADVATVLNCRPHEIIFTGGGTESANMAIYGLAADGYQNSGTKGHIITTTIEHHAVLKPIEQLHKFGWEVDYAPVNKQGLVSLVDLQKLVRPNTNLISVMYANNEIGSIQPIQEIGKWLTGLNKARTKQKLPKIYFHTDACQAGNELPLEVTKLQVDLLTLNGSKIYGPKGVGILYLKNGTPLLPLISGGDQEGGRRAGTENVAAIVGFAKALKLVQSNREKENLRLQELQHYLIDRLLKKVKDITINGPAISKVRYAKAKTRTKKDEHKQSRLYNNINLCIKGVEGEALMLYLDGQNIEVSTGSACNAQSDDPSHVLLAIGLPVEKVYNSIRITLGHSNTKAQLDKLILAFKKYIPILRGVAK